MAERQIDREEDFLEEQEEKEKKKKNNKILDELMVQECV
jgi:hypothetical protein